MGEAPELSRYVFDVDEFREADPEHVFATAQDMTRKRFAIFRDLLRRRRCELACLHEIGSDRIHHCFWRDHDPEHPQHDPRSPYRTRVVEYYALLDSLVGDVLAGLPADVAVLVASDHGAKAMHGAVCVNEILIEMGLLVLREAPKVSQRLHAALIDWEKTRAWAHGGYYARIFFNQRGREAHGIVPQSDLPQLILAVRRELERCALGDGRVLVNQVYEPAQIYRRTRGTAPDLLVFFEQERWRAVSTVGHGARFMQGNDQGVDHANHTRDGMYALRIPGRSRSAPARASLLDVFPTLACLLGLGIDAPLLGRNLAESS